MPCRTRQRRIALRDSLGSRQRFITNDSDYGLGAGIWARDIGRVHRVAARLDAGRIVVNEYSGGFVQIPCGGFKASGYGREQGVDALAHYTQLKSVIIRL